MQSMERASGTSGTVERECPLSALQQRLWFTQQLDPASPVYNQCAVMTPAGALHAEALEQAFNEVLHRHEALRTRFEHRHGEAIQVVQPRASFRLRRVDLAHLPADEREKEAQRITEAEARRPFDLAAAPLLRALLLGLGGGGERLVFTIHHLVCDGWSHRILVRELGALYWAFAQGEPSPLPEPRARYSDVVELQNRALGTERLQKQLAYWNGKLAGAARIELPADRPRSAAMARTGALFSFEAPAELANRLRGVGRRERATLFMTLLSAFKALLQRYTGEEDVVVGTAVANRPDAAARSVIGFFVNTLPLRTAVEGWLTVRELLGRIRETSLGAFTHQDVPFDKIARTLRGDRGADGAAPFGAFFVFETGLEEAGLGGDGLDWRVAAVGSGQAEFDLSLTVVDRVPGSGSLACAVEFSDELFEPATVRRLAGHFERLLEVIASSVETRVEDLPLLTDAERRRQLVDWNDTEADYPSGRCVHELFEEQARRTPDAMAVVHEDAQLSYGELDRRASRLARHLEAQGVGPEVRVGICAERSPETIVGLLAVFKAGGAYVPLDPGYPAERLAFLLEDAGVRALLTQERFLPILPASPAAVVCLDREPAAAVEAGAPRSRPVSRNVAYVIYTSGSTGRPKGVLVEHRSVVNYLIGVGEQFALGSGDRVLQFASLSFDTSVEEIFPCLAYGACLVLRTEAMLDPPALRAGLERHRVTVLDLPTAYWQSLVHLAADVVGSVPSIRLVVIGGEEAPQGAVDAWWRQVGRPVRLLSGYGPTEATVVSSWYELTGDPVYGRGRRTVPLGFPARNAQLYVLAPWMQPVPVGVSGELHIGGVGLAQGYHGRPEMTAERFVPDPFGEAGSRLYRTGDLARYQADGKLEFLGRIDHQVKVRGFRIELGEIETLLAGHPEVAQSVVVAREDRPGEKRLVAYVAGRNGRRPEAGGLRALVAAKLPEHMVPSAFMVLESLPLTPHGKVDRKRLPAPKPGPAERGRRVAPRTEAEAVLARIWAEVLGVEQVGVEDNFFALGGDSILSIQVVARAREAGYQLTLKQIFKDQTVAGMARVAARVETSRAEQELVTGPLPLTPIQSWFFVQELPDPHHFNQAVMLTLRGAADAWALEGAVHGLVRHHDALRLRFVRDGAAWRQTHTGDGAAGVFSRVDLSGLAEEERRGALEASASRAQASLDLTAGPLLRAVLYGLGTAGERLLIVVHHLAVDGVSWRILLEDLQTAYGSLRGGRPVELPAKTASFKEWAERLSALAESAALDEQMAYWSAEQRRNVPRLPVDHPGGEDTVGSARSVSVALSEDETRSLLQEVPEAYRTRIDEVLLAALAEALSTWTGASRVLVDLEGHGREELFDRVDLSRTVGWFTSLYPVVLDRAGCTGPGSLLKAVKEQLRGVPRRGIGYGLLRSLGRMETRDRLAALPQAEISFNYLGQFDQVLAGTDAFAAAAESPGPSQGPGGRRTHAIEVDGLVAGGRLRLEWTYGAARHERETIEALAAAFLRALRGLITHCRSAEAGGATPSDFPLAGLGQEQLERCLGEARDVEDVYPLSPTQQGLLFHSLYAPRSGTYFDQLACRLEGGVDTGAFQRAWQAVVDRHAILRSSFLWEGLPQPLQVVRRRVDLRWTEEDWRHLSPEEESRRLDAFLSADRERGLDLGEAPLLRLALFRVDERAYRFVWSHHHALLDGWAAAAVMQELFAWYEAFHADRELLLEHPRPYRDYIAWLQGQDLGQAEAFWRRTLAGFAEPTPLGVDHPPVESEEGGDPGDIEARLSPELTARLEALVRRHQLTLNTALQGAWALLLSRYGGEEDVVFGATMSGRPAELAGVESMLGLFINTLPVRVRVRPEQGLAAWLAAIQEQQVEARQYEHSPLVDVQGWSEVTRGKPLFESILVFENYPVDAAVQERAGRTLGVAGLRTVIRNHYPLTLTVHPGTQLSLLARYDGRRFDVAAIRRLLGHLAALLEGMAHHAEGRLMDLTLLTEPEHHRLLCEWNAPAAAPASPQCIHELFAEQARERPDAIAVVCEDAQLSYAELDRRANRLARHLVRLGVGPDVRVGICLDRTHELVVSLLGILKAGGAYVPLDPENPAERTGSMLRDADAVVCLDSAWPALDRGAVGIDCTAAEPLPGGVTPGNLAYIIYTSGSTGQPKGVAVEHAQLVGYVEEISKRLGVAPGESYALVSTVAADLGNTVLFPSLAHGGCLHLLGREMVTDAPALGRYFEERWIDYLKIVPSHLAALHLADGGLRILPRRALIVGGEASQARWAAGLRAAAPGMALLNHYGPTEATVGVLTRRVEVDGLPAASLNVPLGRPLPGTQAYVLDAGLQPVPAGVAGELCLGGRGLARGYLGRGDLTAERFVPSPFGEPGARLYRSGDLARHLADGEVEFLGRIDHQVKVRGFRIELGEIEAALCRHPGVGQAAVLVREDQPGEKRLVAYVVGTDGGAELGDLPGHLAASLPEHMMPSSFVAMKSLPLTPNGKLDRRALPAPEERASGRGRGHVAPRTETERVLAGIWAEVLGLERVGAGERFFELGGDSILCIQVIAQAREAGYRLTLKQIFKHQTIAELASVAVPLARKTAPQEPVSGPVPLTPIQRGFFAQELPNPHHFNHAMLLTPRERVDGAALEAAVRELVRHHDALRLRFERDGAGWRQWNAVEGEAGVLSRVDLSGATQWEEALEADSARVQESLSLAAGPLLRVVWYDLGPAGERLLVVIHHLAVDGVSWRILLEDLRRAYEQVRQGRRAELPAKTASFREWARRLAEHAQSSALEAEAPYWTSPERQRTARLPLDHPEGENAAGSARRVSVALSAEETRSLLQDVPGAYRTQIDEVLLAALLAAVAGWSGQRRLLVDLEGHGREELFEGVDLSRTVGWLTTLYPVLLEAAPAGGPGALLKAVKERMRGVPRRGIGYGLLRYLGPEAVQERLAALPGAEIRFNYLGRFDQMLEAAGVFAAVREWGQGTQGAGGARRYALDVSGLIAEGRLEMEWTYGAERHAPETVEALAGSFLRELRALIAHCRSAEAGGYTPSDFPLAGLVQEEIDRLLGGERDVEDVYPLSAMQQGLLLHSLDAPRSGVYFEQLSCRLSGGLEVDAFRRAWQAVVDRHSVLRSSFLWEGLRQPLQVVRRRVEPRWEERDWRGRDESGRLDAFLRDDRERGVALSDGPPMRLALLRTEESAYRLVWSYHHVLLDGWSSAAVVAELFACYDAFRRGEEPVLGRPRPYRDYIEWLQGRESADAEVFWRRSLVGFSTPTWLGVERAGIDPADGVDEPAEEELRLPQEATAALERLARGHQLTLSTVLQGAWALLLSRYSGEADVVFGATVSGRPPELAGVESMLGLFINTLPVRVQVRPEQLAVECLRALQEQQVEARQHEHSPLSDIQGWSEVPRGTPLFATLLVVENYPVDASLRAPAGRAFQVDSVRKREWTSYPMTLVALPGSELCLSFSYDRGRYERAAVRRIAAHLERLLADLAARPEARLLDLSLLAGAERHQLLVGWNDTAAEYPVNRCIHELFEEQAERTPEATAVAGAGESLSYLELEHRANRLGRHLQALGVGPEVRVAICVERSPEMVVGLLGILKAGGAYVPLDPRYPRSRLRLMIEGSGAQVLVTQERLLPELSAVAVRTVCLDRDGDAIAHEHPARPRSWALPGNLAYVIHTSGSTGRPKGVAIAHGSTVAFLTWAGCRFAPDELAGVVASTSICFDLSVFEIFLPLARGGRVLVVGNALEAVGDDGLHPATLINTVPSAIAELLRLGAIPGSVRTINLAGETLAGHLVERLYAETRVERVINLYGPSEDTTYSTWAVLPRSGAVPTIGRPVDNTRVYVTDAGLLPVPAGVAGELSIGGSGLARGYLGRGDLTAERFVPDPFGEPGSRLYRTGDRARHRLDGSVEFLGRIDHQVKLRGFRIEPGEIERVLEEYPAVGRAVVVVREDRPGERRLVAYVVAGNGHMPDEGELRRLTAAQLPEHMVPAAFVPLERLPLTPNGKLDRSALPAPEGGRPETGEVYAPPRTGVERELAEIWSEVLGLDRVGIHDNFFQLGGHSLLAAQVLSRIRARLGVQMRLEHVFSRPTVARQAERIEALGWLGPIHVPAPAVDEAREDGEI